jgi:hypothetical protein
MKKAILAAENLTDKSKDLYLQRIRLWTEGTEKPITTILKNPQTYIQWLQENKPEPQTQKAYLVGILALFKHTKNLKERFPEQYNLWYEAFTTLNKDIEERYKTNEPTPKQQDAYIPLKDIEKKRDTFKEGTKERLLLAMYTYIPPLRNDFHAVYLYQTTPSNPTHPNYLTLDTFTLTLKEHKTVKTVGIYQNTLPKNLQKEIQASLQTQPRDWLFANKKNEPYTAGTFNKWVNRTLEKLFNKPLTISLIRHVYVNDIDFNHLSVAEKERIAKLMCHRMGQQDRYRLFFE